MQRDGLVHLLDRSKDPAFTLTADGDIWSWNLAAERLLGYSAVEALNQSFSTLLQPRGVLGRPIDADYCRLAVREGSVPSFDMMLVARDGHDLWLNVTVLVFEALRGSPALIVHLAHDVTLTKQREVLAQELVETARRFVAVRDDARQLAPVAALSEQEQRILRALVSGTPAHEVAKRLEISDQTLRNHLHHINQKLGTHNRLEAVTHALRRKLI